MPEFGSFQFGEEQFGAEGSSVDSVVWRIYRNNQSANTESNLFDAEVVDTANPFGNYAIAYIQDDEGVRFDEYNRGTRVDFEISTDGGVSFTHRFTGYVVEARELDKQGADALEVECYSFDQFLRRDTVTNDQSGSTILGALENIIKTDTPVTWNASNVEVVDNQTLTQSFRGEKVENALQALASKSGGESFGVNDSVEFFFRPSEADSSPRDITDSDWFNYDIPEQGKEIVNEVTVFFNDGNESVTVDNGADRKELQDNLGTARPVTAATEVNRPEISDIGDARDIGEQILSEREATLTGTVTTFGLFDARPGDVIDITITPRGIDGQFRIAELGYRWGRAETELVIVEKTGEQDDLLVRLSDTLKRTEMRTADRDATGNIITSTNLGVEISGSGDVAGTSFTASRVTNTARNKLRDAWGGSSPIIITEIAVGDDGSAPSRTDTGLVNELERVSVSESLPDATSVLYEGGFSETDIREIGLFDSGGDLISRAIIPATSLTATVNVDYTLTVSNDSGFEAGVVTSTGQTVVRDTLSDNSPSLPTQYAYGSDSTSPVESDTALKNQVVKTGIDEILVQDANTSTEWSGITSFGGGSPLYVDSGAVKTHQTAFTQEAEDGTTSGTNGFFASRFSGDAPSSGEGEAVEFDASGESLEVSFTPAYEIAASDFALYVREESNNTPAMDVTVNGVTWELLNDGATLSSVDWRNIADKAESGVTNGYTGGAFNAGTTYTITFESTSNGGSSPSYKLDVVAPLDSRYGYTFDNTTSTGSDGGTYLDGPEHYPDVVEVVFSEVSTRRELENATATQSWNDVTNNQFIELSNDGGSTWVTTNNSQTASASFGSASNTLQARVGISRYGSRDTATPQTGFNGQEITTHELEADVDAITPAGIGEVDVRAIISPGTISGTTIREAGELDASNNLMTRAVFADRTIQSNQRLISSERVSWDNP